MFKFWKDSIWYVCRLKHCITYTQAYWWLQLLTEHSIVLSIVLKYFNLKVPDIMWLILLMKERHNLAISTQYKTVLSPILVAYLCSGYSLDLIAQNLNDEAGTFLIAITFFLIYDPPPPLEKKVSLTSSHFTCKL